jgi:tetratricopeptide (TPR) repeat protein
VRAKTSIVLPLLVGLFIAQAYMQRERIYPFWEKNYAPRTDSDLSSLSPDQMLFALAGFREMIAGLLWVRADAYFDEGNYDAILPMVRIVTMLDPKQLDVYATGMWHIAYNFTDEAQRSDRRYVAPAIALGREGSDLNPYTYELYFETGWIWYHKVDDDYAQAVKYFEKANEFSYDKLFAQYKAEGASDLEADWRCMMNAIPPARANLLSQAYLRNGQVEDARDRYKALLDVAQEKMGNDPHHQERVNRDTIETNLDNLLVRMSQRGYFAQKRGQTDLTGYDVHPPFDVKFSARVTVIDPKVLVAEGTWGVLPVGTRIRIIVRDADFPRAVPGGMEWDQGSDVDFKVNNKVTFLQDQLYVRNQRFSRKIDMGRDVTMYPFASDNYIVEFYYNPRSAPAHIQDKFGFSGEGMTDRYINTDIREGQRVIFARMEMPKDMINLTGEYRRGRGKPAYVQTENYNDAQLNTTGDVIVVPGLRSEGR